MGVTQWAHLRMRALDTARPMSWARAVEGRRAVEGSLAVKKGGGTGQAHVKGLGAVRASHLATSRCGEVVSRREERASGGRTLVSSACVQVLNTAARHELRTSGQQESPRSGIDLSKISASYQEAIGCHQQADLG